MRLLHLAEGHPLGVDARRLAGSQRRGGVDGDDIELDVVAVYTAAPTPGNQVSSIHTERVPVRRVAD